MVYSLSKNEPIRIDGGENGLVLRCTSGTVWLTCGTGQDRLIAAGQSFTLPPCSLALIEALDCSARKGYNTIHGSEVTLCCAGPAETSESTRKVQTWTNRGSISFHGICSGISSLAARIWGHRRGLKYTG